MARLRSRPGRHARRHHTELPDGAFPAADLWSLSRLDAGRRIPARELALFDIAAHRTRLAARREDIAADARFDA